MTLSKEILRILDDGDEPLCKRIKIADNAFKSSELPLQCKPLLLKWIMKSGGDSNEDTWIFLNSWLNSNSFKNLSRNEIDNREIKSFMKLLLAKIDSIPEMDGKLLETVFNAIVLLKGNRTFQQYFITRIVEYCRLIACILDKIQCPNRFLDFMKNNTLFHKSIIVANDFQVHFLQIILPTLVKSDTRFNNCEVFLQVSKVVQKCIFYNNRKSYGNFMDQFFTEVDSEDQPGPNILFHYLVETYKSDEKSASYYYKLIFHALLVAYDNDFELVYQFFVVLSHSLGFKLGEKMMSNSASINKLPEVDICVERSMDCILEVLKVLAVSKTDSSCKINDVAFSDCLKNLLIDHIFAIKPSSTNYEIITQVIIIDPLIVQALSDQIIVYSMMADNSECREQYEELIISIFNTYSKLHRVENLVSKMMITLSQGFDGSYSRKYIHSLGEKTKESATEGNYDYLRIEDIFTENILTTFSKSIGVLASWQVINVFKTLLYSLKSSLKIMCDVGEDNKMCGIYMQILSILIGNFLSSIRVAEHTVTANVIEKTKKCLDELQEFLQKFGNYLLNREHNHILMRSFLNIAFYWAEISSTLKYYSANEKDMDDKILDSNYSSCNLTFTHPYLTDKEWCLISERITNFGEPPCKQLMYKLFFQRVRAVYIFLPKVNHDIELDLLRNITRDLEYVWRHVLEDRFSVNVLLPKMETEVVVELVEKFMEEHESFSKLHKNQHILNSATISKVVMHVALLKMNKLISKQKRKHNEGNATKKMSTKICGFFTSEFLDNDDCKDLLKSARDVYADSKTEVSATVEWTVSENKLLRILGILNTFPVIYSSDSIQKMYLLYFCSLHKDLSQEFRKGKYTDLQVAIEKNIIGILQQCKFKLTDTLCIEVFCSDILDNFTCCEETFSLVMDNIFRYKDSVQSCQLIVSKITKNLTKPLYMQCSIIIMNGINKFKKSKMPKEIKNVADDYKTFICDKILQLVSNNEPTDSSLAGFAYSFKHHLSQNNEEKLSECLNILDKYVEFALSKINELGAIGYLTLFPTILQNKTKIKTIKEDFPLKVWNVCKDNDSLHSGFEDYYQLIMLIVGHIPNEHFSTFMADLLNNSEKVFAKPDVKSFRKNLKTWEAILSSNVNPVKSKVVQSGVEELLYKIFFLLENHQYNKDIFEGVLDIEKNIIQTNHIHLTPAIMDMLLLNITILMKKANEDFPTICNISTSLLSSLLKYRKPLIMDRLPPYLQQYRIILRGLCEKSNSDLEIEEDSVRQVSDCAHQLEKLTRSLVVYQKDMGRIAMYLIADILEQYEQITLFSNVKIHLNNCVYSLMSICDQHAVSYLMRVLSNASTEIFKIMYENYKKYYRFTGKV
ncbi:hypothetical protein JTB14_018096 [Gonioctena quinquepunctata]|nr:hypothetical protein JTB14_018096 [Gonioctena quinquepunctata]